MARQSSSPRKRRTREHIIADMAVTYVERQVLRCGFVVERVVHDYGLDLFLFTYDANGEVQTAWIPLQVKATDRIQMVGEGRFVSCRIDRADLRSWLAEPFPVILIVYDAKKERAYWMHVQAHFGVRRFRVAKGEGTISVRIPKRQVLNVSSVQRFAGFRDDVINRWKERTESHE